LEERVVLTNVAFTRVGGVLITCLGKADPTDVEIDRMIERFKARDYQSLLFSAKGAGPNSKQRALIADYWKKTPEQKPPRTILLSDSMPARFVAQAISWLLGVDTRCFAPHELEAGLQHLGSPAPVADVAGTLAALHSAIEFKQRRVG
jgi:hypothetical protein